VCVAIFLVIKVIQLEIRVPTSGHLQDFSSFFSFSNASSSLQCLPYACLRMEMVAKELATRLRPQVPYAYSYILLVFIILH
jgi:hypothetical protein